MVMSTDLVTNNSDDPTVQGSLPYELAHAQSGDTINFASDYTIDLNSTLQILTNVQIDAASAGGVTIDGQNKVQDIVIDGANVSIDDLTVQGGKAVSSTLYLSGGGIDVVEGYAPTSLKITNSIIRNNSAFGGNTINSGVPGTNAAGGIYVSAGSSLALNSSDVFSGNSATGGTGTNGKSSGRGLYAGGQGGAGGYAGGGIVKAAQAGQAGAGKYGGSGGAAATAPLYRAANGSYGKAYKTDTGSYQGAGGGGGGGAAFQDVGGRGSVTIVCFAAGTRISAARDGEVRDIAVEALAIGDFAVTASGAHCPIKWLGHRTIDCSKHPRPHEARPVRITAQAFGLDRPKRDLFLSPGHPVLIGADENGNGGHLVPIMCLINGTSVARVPVATVTYWHVELDAHDILLAEGLPAESYLDWGDRAFFTGSSDHVLANPDLVVPGLAGRCRPVAIDGPIVEEERCRLDVVFAMRLACASAWPNEAPLEPFQRADAMLW